MLTRNQSAITMLIELSKMHVLCVISSAQKLAFIHLVTLNETFIIAPFIYLLTAG